MELQDFVCFEIGKLVLEKMPGYSQELCENMNRDAGQILFQIKSILKSGQSDFMMIEEIISCLGQYGIQVDCHDFG